MSELKELKCSSYLTLVSKVVMSKVTTKQVPFIKFEKSAHFFF